MSSVTDPLVTSHSDSVSNCNLTAPFPVYGHPISALSPDTTLLASTRLTATPDTWLLHHKSKELYVDLIGSGLIN